MSKPISIYTLSCPITGMVRYVGKTINPKERLRKHLTAKRNTYCPKWIKGLKSKGLLPVFAVIDEVSESEWQDKEREYIRLFKTVGASLTNMTEGGEGGATMTGRKLTKEQARKIAQSKIGKPNKGAAAGNVQHKGKPVEQYDLKGNLIAIHPSIRQAAAAIGRDSIRIQYMCRAGCLPNGKAINHVGGYKFKYA